MTITLNELRAMAERYTQAWCSLKPEAVASFFAEDGQIIINNGDPSVGRATITEMASGFYAEFPDLVVHMDDVRLSADNHAIYVWTLEGKHSETGNYVKAGGWEEWDLTDDLQIKLSLGRFDPVDYDRQVAGES